jgi:deoxyribonuclease-2
MKWLVGLLSLVTANAISCQSEQGSPVDSWLILKAPKSTTYSYADPNTSFQQSSYSSLNLTTKGALAYTTQQMWNSDISYFIYNDEEPINTTYSFTYGHLKGYAMFDETDNTAVWVQHSIPKFLKGPSDVPSYQGLLSNAWENAQHMFCMSLTISSFNQLATSFMLTRPRIFDSLLSDSLERLYPTLAKMIGGSYSTAPLCTSTSIQTQNSMNLIIFEKSTQWNNALWDGCVAPFFQSGLYVQSWLLGNKMGPNCSQPDPILDVETIKFSPTFSWTSSNDHSKWGLTITTPIICFGDINRVYSQAARGGGAVCTSEVNYIHAFTEAKFTTDTCM